jgi:hypothetical protein
MSNLFFEFHQNNSGGHFDIRDKQGIGPRVWIEACDAADADHLAERIGIYFDGVRDGADCPCCGDRWHQTYTKGETKPRIDPEFDFNWHDTVYVHHLDGRIERITGKPNTR